MIQMPTPRQSAPVPVKSTGTSWAIQGNRAKDARTIDLSMRGQGKRTVRVAYIVEAPVWKASYRLTLAADPAAPEPVPPPQNFTQVHIDPLTGENAAQAGVLPDGLSPEQRQALPVSSLPEDWEQTARNAACPCGSGKKFKHCHGSLV